MKPSGKPKSYRTVDAVLNAIGRDRVKAVTGMRSQNFWNWADAGVFPPNTYVVLKAELAAIGATAPDALWQMIPAKKAA